MPASASLNGHENLDSRALAELRGRPRGARHHLPPDGDGDAAAVRGCRQRQRPASAPTLGRSVDGSDRSPHPNEPPDRSAVILKAHRRRASCATHQAITRFPHRRLDSVTDFERSLAPPRCLMTEEECPHGRTPRQRQCLRKVATQSHGPVPKQPGYRRRRVMPHRYFTIVLVGVCAALAGGSHLAGPGGAIRYRVSPHTVCRRRHHGVGFSGPVHLNESTW